MKVTIFCKAISTFLLALFSVNAGNSAVPGSPDGTGFYAEAEVLMDKVTFRVDMAGQSVNPSGAYLASDFFASIGLTNWNPMPMCNVGGGVWEISFCGIPPGTYQYKFLNGPGGWEFDGFGGPCTNPLDNQNRFVTVVGGAQLEGPYGFSNCANTGNPGGVDNTPPTILGPVPANATIACGNPLPVPAPLSASDGCDANCTITTGMPTDNTSGLNPCGLGTVIRTWSVSDCAGNTTTASQAITLVDNTPPTINAPSPAPVTVGCGALPPALPLPASDACDAGVTTTGPPVDNTSGLNACGVGLIQRTWTVTDCSGNTTSVSQAITLQDNVPPVIAGAPPASITVACGAVPPAAPLAATDACDAGVATTGPPSDDMSGVNACGVGVMLRTWTVTDCSGNMASFTQTITLQDGAPPAINGPVPGNITIACGGAPPGAALPASDDCDGSVTTTGPPSDDMSGLNACGVGVILRTWSVTDCAGNTTTATQTITITDAIPPAINGAPANLTINCNGPIPPALPLAASDNCDPAVTTTGMPLEDNSGLNACGLGTLIRTWTVADCSGNTASVSQAITLVDNAPPAIAQQPPPNLFLDCSDPFPQAAPLPASDNCDAGVLLTNPPVDDFSGLDACGTGTVVRTWTVADCAGNTASATQFITLSDQQPPLIADQIPADVVVACDEMPPAAPLAAFDFCDGSVASTGMPVDDLGGLGPCGAGQVVRTWAVQDCSGNIAVASQVITLVDDGPPTIDGPVAADVTVSCGALPPAQPLAASDDCDGSISSTGMPADDTSGLDACGVGEVVRTWSATDCSGNTVSVSQVITVVDDAPPALAIPPDTTLDCNNIPAASAADATATDNCSVPAIAYDGEMIFGSGCSYEIHRAWTATDACGNAVSLTQVITVQDTVPPVFGNAPADITVCEGALPPMADLGWTDNCDGAGSVSGSESTDGMSNPETISRTWAYTDGCGNAASHTQTITVVAALALDAGQDRAICAGEEASLSPSLSGGVDSTFWISTGDGSFDDPSSPDAVYTPGGNDLSVGQVILIFTALPLAADCLPATDTVVLDILALPVADAGAGQQITCGDPTVVLGSPGGGAGLLYEWSGPGIDDSNRNDPMPEVGVPGTYVLAVSLAGAGPGCTVTDTVVVTTDTGFPVAAAGGDQVIDCRQAAVSLDGSGSSVGGDFIYSWSGPGIDASNQDELSPLVSVPGVYTLTISNTANGCTASGQAEVRLDTLAPAADAGISQVVDCDDPVALLDGGNSSAGTNITYQWLAPDGSALGSGSQQNVSVPGVYTLQVTDILNGCAATAAVEVTADTLPPAIDVGPGRTLTCAVPAFTLSAGSPGAGVNLTYSWTLGGVPIGNDSTLVVSAPGNYGLVVTNTANGCAASDEVAITENTQAPVADAGPGGLLTCTANCLDLGGAGTSIGPDFIYQWVGSSNAVADAGVPNPEVCAPDTYILLVADTINGCTARDTVEVAEDASLPAAEAQSADTLSCSVSVAVLSGLGSSTGAEFEYEWRDGAGQAISSGIETTVSTPGLYTLVVINTQTQCRSVATINVPIDTIAPVADAGADAVRDCANLSVELGGNSAGPGIRYEWQDAQGNTLGTAPRQVVSMPGLYTLLATNANNGCSASDEVMVVDNIAFPEADAGADRVLDCVNSGVSLDGSGSSTGGNFIYAWSGPGFNSDTLTPVVTASGLYVLAVTDTSNFCMAADTVAVTVDTIAPLADVGPDGLLTCAATTVQLDGSGSAQGLAYEWTDTAGGLLGSGLTLSVAMPGQYFLQVTDMQNGCSAVDEAVVAIDTVAPVAVAAADGILTCDRTTATLDGFGSDSGGNYSYLWSGPGLAGDSTSLLAEATAAGVYTLTVANLDNGCVASEATEVQQNTTPPIAFAGTDQALTCREPLASLSGSASAAGALFRWSGPGIDASNENLPNPTVGQAGQYSLVVTDTANGCASVPASVIVTDNRELPPAEAIATDSLDCQTASARLDGANSAQGDTISYQWYFQGQPISGATAAEWVAEEAGEYVLEVSNTSTGCNNTDTVILIENLALPPVQIEGGGTLNCYQPALELTETAAAGLPNLLLEWSTAGGNFITPSLSGAAVEIDAGGWYIVTVLNTENGCEQADSVLVGEDFEAPVLALEDTYQLDCQGQGVVVLPVFDLGAGELSFEWAGPGFSAATPEVSITAPGNYTLAATLLRTGCQATAATVILESDGISSIAAQAVPPPCFGEAGGFIQVDTVIGGVPPYLFALDGGPFVSGSSFGPLASGDYTLIVQDSEGCEQEQALSVPEAEVFELILEETIELAAGDSVQLSVEPTLPVAVYSWSAAGDSTLSCRDCPSPLVSPALTTVYTLLAVSESGCQAEGRITVRVVRRDDIYAPNAFSPNGDDRNDYFTLYPRQAAARIRLLQVFDRWGTLLFEAEGIPGGVPELGWDGRANGSELDAGVYVYRAEVLLPDGRAKVVSGGVALLR